MNFATDIFYRYNLINNNLVLITSIVGRNCFQCELRTISLILNAIFMCLSSLLHANFQVCIIYMYIFERVLFH